MISFKSLCPHCGELRQARIGHRIFHRQRLVPSALTANAVWRRSLLHTVVDCAIGSVTLGGRRESFEEYLARATSPVVLCRPLWPSSRRGDAGDERSGGLGRVRQSGSNQQGSPVVSAGARLTRISIISRRRAFSGPVSGLGDGRGWERRAVLRFADHHPAQPLRPASGSTYTAAFRLPAAPEAPRTDLTLVESSRAHGEKTSRVFAKHLSGSEASLLAWSVPARRCSPEPAAYQATLGFDRASPVSLSLSLS